MTTLETIKTLAAKQFGNESSTIDEDAPVDTLGLDSLSFLEFLFELEDEFAIAIPQEAVATTRTLRELGAVIDRLLAERSALTS